MIQRSLGYLHSCLRDRPDMELLKETGLHGQRRNSTKDFSVEAPCFSRGELDFSPADNGQSSNGL